MGGSLTTPTAPQMKDVAPNRCGEPMILLYGGEGVSNSIRSFRGVSETLKIIFEKDRVILEGDGNGDDLRIELTSRFGGVRGISYGEECTTAIYVLKHLLDALNVFESSKTPTLALFVKDTYPLKLEGMFKNRFNRVRFYLQPLFVD